MTSFTKAFKATGTNGDVLQQVWQENEQPKAYLSVTSVSQKFIKSCWQQCNFFPSLLIQPGFPNLFFCHGPNSGLGHNSVLYMLECQNNYITDCIGRLIQSGHQSLECRQDKLDSFYKDIFAMMKLRVFGQAGGCLAWYTNSKGVNWTLWPSDLTHFWWKTKTCNLNDYHLK